MRRVRRLRHRTDVRIFLSILGSFLAVLVIAAGLGGIKYKQISSLIEMGKVFAAAGPPPETVSSGPALAQSWEGRLTAVGSVATEKGVTVSVEVSGKVNAIKFESGAVVKKGQILVELDSSVERAQLASAAARRDAARLSAERSKALVEKNVGPKSEADNDAASLRSAAADVSALAAQIERKTIRAPFDGKLGIRQVNVGQYLNPGTPIVVLQSTDAVYVDFSLPQQDELQLAVGGAVKIIANGVSYDGALAAIDPTVSATTRSLQLRASVAGADVDRERLRPGMFVEVAVILGQARSVVAVPATAIIHASYGDSIFLLENGTAKQQFVRVGEARGDFVAIVDGVKAGQEVVTEGAFKLRNGSKVVVNNTVKAEPKLAPRPENR